MKILLSSFLFLCIGKVLFAQDTLPIMEHVVYYDGYAALSAEPTPENVVRLRNDLNTIPLNPVLLSAIKTNLKVEVTISARCDNYDRIGNVFLAFVPKGQKSYVPHAVTRIELGRFITPFMNKNKDPKSVVYTFDVPELCGILKNKTLLKTYDFWIELGVFGVPYAAQKEVSGCSDRNDTFEGKLRFITGDIQVTQKQPILVPITTYSLMNNYEVNATDTLGKTTRTFTIDLPVAVENAHLVIITSNHGANEGGEEYVRREHLVSVDDSLRLKYTPGGKSCEEFRKYNTQGNGIYGKVPETDSSWASWNNWCPGNSIPTRTVNLGTLSKGKHRIQIRVPEAVFMDANGYFPLSLYIYGTGKSKQVLILE